METDQLLCVDWLVFTFGSCCFGYFDSFVSAWVHVGQLSVGLLGGNENRISKLLRMKKNILSFNGRVGLEYCFCVPELFLWLILECLGES